MDSVRIEAKLRKHILQTIVALDDLENSCVGELSAIHKIGSLEHIAVRLESLWGKIEVFRESCQELAIILMNEGRK